MGLLQLQMRNEAPPSFPVASISIQPCRLCSPPEPSPKFANLMNYATFPFYWPSFERQLGQPRYEYMDKVAAWCIENDIDRKGHPLVWNHTAPRWIPADAGEIKRLSDARVQEIVARYRGKIDIWDVVNEATDPFRFDNPITEAWRAFGQMPFTIEPFNSDVSVSVNTDILKPIGDSNHLTCEHQVACVISAKYTCSGSAGISEGVYSSVQCLFENTLQVVAD